MIYNSNENNAPYQNGGNTKVNKQLRALEESIDNVTYRLNGYVGTDDTEINGMIGDALDNIREDVDNAENAVANLGPRVSGLENTIDGYSTKIVTSKIQATDADFHSIVCGKYLFQNGYETASSEYICQLKPGSVVYATDGTNGILVDFADVDAWVANAHIGTENAYFKIYENGVLQFSTASSFSVYVIGNVFDTTVASYGNPTNIQTGITIGGTLYAALAQDYTFRAVTTDTITVNGKALIGEVETPKATVTDLEAESISGEALVVDNARIVETLTASKRNIKDAYIPIDSHATNVNVYIELKKFTGLYNLRLDKTISGAVETLFTATVIWNGKTPIVNYHENQNLLDRDYLYKIILTEDALYFVTQGDGTLYYSYDSFDAIPPETEETFTPSGAIICDYTTAYADRTVFLGNDTEYSGVDVLGELNADVIHLPEDFSITDLSLDGNLTVNGTTTLNGNTTADNITVEDITLTGDINAGGSTGTEGQVLTIKEGHPAWEDSGGTSTYTNLATDNLTVKQKMAAGGTGQFSYARAYKGKEEDIAKGIISGWDCQVIDSENHVYYFTDEDQPETIYSHVSITNDTSKVENFYSFPTSKASQLTTAYYYSIRLQPTVRSENPSQPVLGSAYQGLYCYPDNRNIVDFWKNYTNGEPIALPSYELIEAYISAGASSGTPVIPNDAWWVYDPTTDGWTPYTMSDFQNLGINVFGGGYYYTWTFASYEVDKNITVGFEYEAATGVSHDVGIRADGSGNRYVLSRRFTKEEELTPAEIKTLVESELVYFAEFDNVNDLPDLNTFGGDWVSNTYAFVGNTLYTYLPNISEPGWQEMPGILGPIGEEYNILTPFVSFTVPAITNVPDYDYFIGLNGTVKLDDFNVIDSNNKLGSVGETLTKTENGIEWKKSKVETFDKYVYAYTDYHDMSADTTNVRVGIAGQKYNDVITITWLRISTIGQQDVSLTNYKLYLKKSDLADLLELGKLKVNFVVKPNNHDHYIGDNWKVSLIGNHNYNDGTSDSYTLKFESVSTLYSGTTFSTDTSDVPLITYVGSL